VSARWISRRFQSIAFRLLFRLPRAGLPVAENRIHMRIRGVFLPDAKEMLAMIERHSRHTFTPPSLFIDKSVTIIRSFFADLIFRKLFSGSRAILLPVLFVLIWGFIVSPVRAHEINSIVYTPRSGAPIRIGALANRGVDECLKRWRPTAAFLERHLPGSKFEIVPLGFDEVANTVASGRVHFIVTNPAQYSVLEFTGKAYRIAGFLVPSVAGPQRIYGGVIFTRAYRRDIRRISDLKGKRFAAVDSESLGGWLCARRELQAAGIDPYRDFADLKFAGTHDAVIKSVLSGSCDAGTIRSSQFEMMAAEGKVNLGNFHVLPGPSTTTPGYPFLVSTRLYPEWPLAVVKGTDENLSRMVAVALMTMGADDPAAKASGGSGWTIPADYSDVHELLRELHLGPYKELGRVTPAMILSIYWPHLLATAGAIFLISLFAVKASILNRRLKVSMEELTQRTIALNASNKAQEEANRDLSQEVVARKAAEEASTQSVSLLRATIESTNDGILVVDKVGSIVDWNKRFLKLWRIPDDLILSRDDDQALAYVLDQLTNPDEFMAKVRELYNQPEEESLDILRFKDGRIFERYSRPQQMNNEIVGRVWSFRDITEREKMEDELRKAQKLESLGVLAGGIAHDFNNLLTGIMGNVSLAKMFVDPMGKAYPRLGEAEKACSLTKKLTQQFLTFAKGGDPIKKVDSMTRIIMDTASFVLRGSNVRCDYLLPEDLWAVEVDSGQMSQVINNLIINADQAMPDGGTIIVQAENVTLGDDRILPLPEGRYVHILIRDQGMGIPEEIQPKIFDPYFTTKKKGSGLGLASVYSIIIKHDGYVGMESKSGMETTFHLYLPASEKRFVEASSLSEPQKPGKVEGRILIMDDERVVRDTAREILVQLGYQIDVCDNGTAALNLYREARESRKPYDVVFMDLTIPGGMGGKVTMKKLLEIDPDAKGVVMSGYSNDPILVHYREYGFCGVVTKPFTANEIFEALQTLR
jgi:PAS domain S-box-containing protein